MPVPKHAPNPTSRVGVLPSINRPHDLDGLTWRSGRRTVRASGFAWETWTQWSWAWGLCGFGKQIDGPAGRLTWQFGFGTLSRRAQSNYHQRRVDVRKVRPDV